jgi:hypothetical protein
LPLYPARVEIHDRVEDPILYEYLPQPRESSFGMLIISAGVAKKPNEFRKIGQRRHRNRSE